MPSRHAVSQFFHVVVNNHYGVVYYHSQCHYECCQCHSVQFHAEEIENADRREYGDRNAEGRNLSHASWHQQDDHNDDRNDRDEQFLQKVHHRFVHHFALVGDGGDMHILWQGLLKLVQCLVDIISHLHDIVSWSHLDRQEHTFVAIALDVFLLFRVFPRYACNVFEPHDVAFRVGIYNLFRHITFVVVGVGDMDRQS